MMRPLVSMLLGVAALSAWPTSARAQSLGTFRWQLQPFCNVVVVTITEQDAVYTVDGFDDQCGAPRRAPLVGLATPNPDGSIGLGLNIVTAPGGRAVQIDGRISLSGLSGSWTDSAGNSGSLAFGASTGGSPRPPAAVGATLVNPAEVQLRVSGACAAGEFVRTINQDGTVACAPGVRAGPGVARVQSGELVFHGIRTSASGGFDLTNSGGIVANHSSQSGGAIGAEGPGRRFLYHLGKDALRIGQVSSTQWDDANIGRYSFATGFDTLASGFHSIAMGAFATASGPSSVAIGNGTVAGGFGSVAMGIQSSASGDTSVALGFHAVALPAAGGSFVFADRSSTNSFTSFAPNEFIARAAGGVGFYTNAALTTGVEMAANGSSWAPLSDANAKENFREVDGEDLLAKLARIPVREWNYKAQDAAIRHMGPTAQDFRAAFGLGDFELRINTVDADGVALAGVQALEARTRALADENHVLRQELEALRQRLDSLLTARPQ